MRQLPQSAVLAAAFLVVADVQPRAAQQDSPSPAASQSSPAAPADPSVAWQFDTKG